RAALAAPRGDAAVEHRARVEAGGVQHARCDRRARTALADRDDRFLAAETGLGRLSRRAVREMVRAGDELPVALVGLAHVEKLDLAGRQPSLELVDRHRLHALVAAAGRPARDPEDADGPEPSRRRMRLRLAVRLE